MKSFRLIFLNPKQMNSFGHQEQKSKPGETSLDVMMIYDKNIDQVVPIDECTCKEADL